MNEKLQDKNVVTARRELLRNYLRSQRLDAWLQPVADEFQGEYPASYARRLHAISGFTGSAGLGVFFADASQQDLLLVDGRYTLQAAAEVDTAMTQILLAPPASLAASLAHTNATIGFDPWLHTIAQVRRWHSETAHAQIVFTPAANAVDTIWPDAPEIPSEPFEIYPQHLAGISAQEKIAALMHSNREKNADACVLTLPDGICWLLNIRGADIDYNPLVLGYLVISAQGDHRWYVQPREVGAAMLDYLAALGVTMHPLKTFWQDASQVMKQFPRVILDADHAPHALMLAARHAACEVVESADFTLLAKAQKNTVELDAIRAVHVRDGAALSCALALIQRQAGTIDELGAMRIIEACRRENSDYRGASFATIAGVGSNGAIVHYHASAISNRIWQNGALLLLDSGGQYLGGTTDVTRVLLCGGANAEIKDRYTRVLKGHIALACAQFPAGTSGAQLDILARQFLWEIGCDYDHGTGHGVGAFLCVHEGPQSISKRSVNVALQANMVLSNEPGYYKTGAYGIRIENLVCVVPRGTSADGREMLGFETLTLVPIETALVDLALLNAAERNWLNDYHARVQRETSPYADLETKAWIAKACAPI